MSKHIQKRVREMQLGRIIASAIGEAVRGGLTNIEAYEAAYEAVALCSTATLCDTMAIAYGVTSVTDTIANRHTRKEEHVEPTVSGSGRA